MLNQLLTHLTRAIDSLETMLDEGIITQEQFDCSLARIADVGSLAQESAYQLQGTVTAKLREVKC